MLAPIWHRKPQINFGILACQFVAQVFAVTFPEYQFSCNVAFGQVGNLGRVDLVLKAWLSLATSL